MDDTSSNFLPFSYNDSAIYLIPDDKREGVVSISLSELSVSVFYSLIFADISFENLFSSILYTKKYFKLKLN